MTKGTEYDAGQVICRSGERMPDEVQSRGQARRVEGMLGDAMRRDAMRCDAVVGKKMLEARAEGFLKTTAGHERERTGVGTVALGLGRGRDGGRGLMTSEVNRKRKSSGYVATGWDRSTRFVSSGLLVSFELTRQCQLGRGPLDLGH